MSEKEGETQQIPKQSKAYNHSGFGWSEILFFDVAIAPVTVVQWPMALLPQLSHLDQ